MTTETETEQIATQDQADQEAAFAASFAGKDIPQATKPTETPKPAEGAEATPAAKDVTAQAADPKAAATDPASAQPATTPTPEAASTTPSPKGDENAELRAAMRRMEGRYGALNDQLQQLKTSKETEGKPAVATQVELARMKAEYPELADALTEDLAKAIGGLAGKSADPKEIEKLVSQGVAREAAVLRDQAVADVHPNWQADIFNKDAAGEFIRDANNLKTPTADYLAWRKTMTEDEAAAFERTTNPYHVIKKLSSFYEWKTKAAKAEDAKQQRLKAAVTPQGVPRASPTTISDDEAMKKGFEEGFNS